MSRGRLFVWSSIPCTQQNPIIINGAGWLAIVGKIQSMEHLPPSRKKNGGGSIILERCGSGWTLEGRYGENTNAAEYQNAGGWFYLSSLLFSIMVTRPEVLFWWDIENDYSFPTCWFWENREDGIGILPATMHANYNSAAKAVFSQKTEGIFGMLEVWQSEY